MSITTGQNADASDFINESEKNATPANDAGRVPKLESDQKLHPYFVRLGKQLDAGETLNGGTLPVPVYQNDSDNELYACDANDATKYKFIGFVTSNSTDGNPIRFQGAGVIGGFSGLSEGEKYYVQDTAGTIGTSPGTQEILVGVAISTTELLIMKGTMKASGVANLAGAATSTITTGFRPSAVRVFAIGISSASDSGDDAQPKSMGGYINGVNRCAYGYPVSGSDWDGQTTSSYSWYIQIGDAGAGGDAVRGVIDNVTDTGFRLNQESVDAWGGTAYIYWEAEGDL